VDEGQKQPIDLFNDPSMALKVRLSSVQHALKLRTVHLSSITRDEGGPRR
jgi:hypothetical protein